MTWQWVYFILLILSALCFLRSTLGASVVDGAGRTRLNVSLLPLGLLFWVLVPLIQYARVLF